MKVESLIDRKYFSMQFRVNFFRTLMALCVAHFKKEILSLSFFLALLFSENKKP